MAGGDGPVEALSGLATFNVFVIFLEAIVLGSYLRAMKHRAPASVNMLTRGRLASAFWGGVVVAALILPFIMEALKAFILSSPGALLTLGLLEGIIGLIGGCVLRGVVVYGGTRNLLNVRGQLVVPPAETYETRAIESAYQGFQKA